MQRVFIIGLAFLFMLFPMHANAEGLLIIISHKSNEVLDIEQVKSLYTLKRKLLPSGNKAKLTMLSLKHDYTVTFTQGLYDLYPYQLSRVWDRRVFSGVAKLPQQFDTALEMLNHVRNTPNSIGYYTASEARIDELKETVNVIIVSQ